jgi:hypothetical protein
MKVAVVVEPQYDGLALLVSKMPVWIVESSENKSSATKIWGQKADSKDLTTFKVQNLSQKHENCLGIIDAIELHHPTMTELFVFGLEDTDGLRQEFLELGYLLESTKDMVLARKF